MVKPFSFSASPASGRKDKKRQHATVSSPGLSDKAEGKKDASRMQLDDILSSLTAGTTNGSEKGKQREKKEVEKPLKKKLKNETKGTQVSALDLLLGVGGGSKEGKPLRKEKKPDSAVKDEGQGATIRHGKDKPKVKALDDHAEVLDRNAKKKDPDAARKEQRDVSSFAPSMAQPRASTATKTGKTSQHSSLPRTESPSDERHTSPPVSFTRPIKSTTTPSDRPTPAPFGQATSISKPSHPIPSPSSSITAADDDRAFHTLKTFKLHLRQLTAVLSSLSTELTLIDRIWYKNASQFKSALWWGGFDSVRRCLHRVLLPSSRGVSLAHSVVSDLTLLYARLGGAESNLVTTASTSTLPPIPKFTTRPTHTTLQTYLSSSPSHLEHTTQQLEALQTALLALSARCTTAGRTLLLHLNTPPAPTFAPLVTALIALLAGVDDALQSVVPRKHDGEEMDSTAQKAGAGAVEELLKLLRGLAQESTI
ncbi:hypothetical protein PHSY_006164 [Pseudozyma hubeiensis SY62]|uniref:Uncharacterized protein n=1 Tax=Pseudozyma hubeiensis (strain SY62) TaxID=1305764 RepID=R9PKC0_PSEHS|nr:hypothetical protein PHSY_006164 [Pseudozyma hubeiensis SY62]GAC98570.1 hypothetical protein PHSY_006164 [Pseudozyma hubeiensis SY62]